MKAKYILMALCLLLTNVCFGQKQLFDKYADKDHVTSVYISKTMFQMMLPAVQSAGLQLMNMAGKVEGLQLVATENEQQAKEMRKDFSSIVGKGHEELMRVKHENMRATFHIKQEGEKIKELLMLADKDKGFIVIQLLGDFTLNDIMEITSEMTKQN